MNNLIELYCVVDDFIKDFIPAFEKDQINDKGELMVFKMSQATTDDRIPVDQMTQGLEGKLIGDKGYISKELFDKLYQRALKLITKIKKNMKNKLMPMIDKLLLRKRAIVESVIMPTEDGEVYVDYRDKLDKEENEEED